MTMTVPNTTIPNFWHRGFISTTRAECHLFATFVKSMTTKKLARELQPLQPSQPDSWGKIPLPAMRKRCSARRASLPSTLLLPSGQHPHPAPPQ